MSNCGSCALNFTSSVVEKRSDIQLSRRQHEKHVCVSPLRRTEGKIQPSARGGKAFLTAFGAPRSSAAALGGRRALLLLLPGCLLCWLAATFFFFFFFLCSTGAADLTAELCGSGIPHKPLKYMYMHFLSLSICRGEMM